MKHNYFWRGSQVAGLLLGLWLLATSAQAQAPAWTLATTITTSPVNSTSYITDIVADASGNLLVTGNFTGQVTFSSTILNSIGRSDFFIAKYLTATNTWAWAMQGGGTSNDTSYGLALNGTSFYITGAITNTIANDNNVILTSTSPSTGSTTVPVRGSTSTVSSDLLVAKYTDIGTGATLNWTQLGGGTATDQGYGIALNGPNVYVIGTITNNQANTTGVVFGSNGTVAGTTTQVGASTTSSSDILVAKYTDNGSSATLGWMQVAGGLDSDNGYGIAVSGSNVYITGASSNDRFNTQQVLFGGTGTMLGTVAQYGVSHLPSADAFVAKYVDNGLTAALAWTQVGGGVAADQAYSIAINGSAIYVAGQFVSNVFDAGIVLFGGSGSTPGPLQVLGASSIYSPDLFLAKYTDMGTSALPQWVHVGGGSSIDAGYKVLVNGSTVYVTGALSNEQSNSALAVFGGSNTVVGHVTQIGASSFLSSDIVVAKYTDTGASALLNWTQIGGGTQDDSGKALALTSSRLYVGGSTMWTATFGSLSINAPANNASGFLGAFGATMLATTPPLTATGCTLFPNPAPGAATLSGATPNTTVHILDALGRRVATATADASGAAPLPAGLAPGLYLVRAGASTVRWTVE